MTATDNRQGRTAVDPLSLLPLALIIIMFGVAVFIALVAPSRVTSGVYQVTVGEGPTQFRIATESLTCSRIGHTATCAAPVAGRALTVDVEYHDRNPSWGSACTARHGDRPVPCMPLNNIGHASSSVWITDSLGVTEPELTQLRDAVPWWRTGDDPPTGALVLIGVLTAAAGVATYVLSGRARPQPDEWRFPIAAGTGLLGWTLFLAGSVMTASDRSAFGLAIVFGLSAPVLLASTMLMVWQYQLGGAGGHGRGRRFVYAICGAIATAFYTAAAMLVLLLNSGFID